MAHWLNAGSIRRSDVEKEQFTEYYKDDSKLFGPLDDGPHVHKLHLSINDYLAH